MSVIKHQELHRAYADHKATAFVFEDKHSKALMSYIEQIAPSHATVMIYGETGTGKEIVAREIHRLSDRSDRPFIAVNCGAFSDELAEAELFGHERGAYTGAVQGQIGWFEQAQGGTIFLDEIGDLSPAVQVKLLRILQEKEVVRLGSRQIKKIDVRVIVATNVDLEEAVEQGDFREDLYFRLKVAPLQILPLRLRPDDIEPLAKYYVIEYAKRLKKPIPEISAETLAFLYDYPWPGNIRELENAIHHAILIHQDQVLQPHHFKLSGRKHHITLNDYVLATSQYNSVSLKQILFEWFEKGEQNLDDLLDAELIKAAYEFCHGNQLHTAKLLGVSRNIIRARLIKHGLLQVSTKTSVTEDVE